MNFTITITGEDHELTSALRAVKAALEGHDIARGEISATVQTPIQTPIQPTQQTLFQGQTGQPTDFQQFQQQPVQQFQQPVQQQQYQPQQQQPVQQQQGQSQPLQAGGVPVSVPTYTPEQLAVAATQLVDAGRRGELVALLSTFGVDALTMLPKEAYGTFATHLRAMGAKI